MRLIVLSFIIFILSIPCVAQISVNVSEKYGAIHYSNVVEFTPGKVVSIDLHLNDYRDEYKVYYHVPTGGLTMIVLDGRDRKTNNQSPNALHESRLVGVGFTSLPALPSNEGAILAFVNRGSTVVRGEIRVDRIGTRPIAIRKTIENIVALPVRSLNKAYVLPKLSITVKPCGQINAFSTPDIVICSELIAELSEKDLAYALWPVVLHELGHSILWIWKIPGYDNEDVVDNFAAAMLAKVAPKAIEQYVSWFESMDPIAEAAARLASASKHPLSIHRARALQKLVRDPSAEMSKWDELLKPYLRK
jgi:hypothetical protein